MNSIGRNKVYMTVQELSQNEKYKFWYFKIKECKDSPLSIKEFCKVNGLSSSTYFKYQQRIKQLLCDQVNDIQSNKNEISFVSLPASTKEDKDDRIIIIKSSIKIVFDSHTSFQEVESILRTLLC